ncbi:MAG: hypothetical protein P4L92_12305 [Rudaea sp.]|nr:hypothetical protein [Rudaea sp.]
MKLSRSLIAAGLLVTATTFTAYAAVEQVHRFEPPTAEQLGLSGTYMSQWNELRSQTLNLRRSASAQATQRIKRLRELLTAPAPDLGAFNRESEQATDKLLAQARALKARKIALYDSLPPAQQARLRALLVDHLDRLQQLPWFKAMADRATTDGSAL